MIETKHTDAAPAAVGPYSQAVVVDDWVYTSGQVPLDPATGQMVTASFEEQVRQVLENLDRVLAACECSFSDVVKTTIYVTDLASFPTLNELYARAMGDHRPARSTVQVAALAMGADVEIDMVARRS